MGDTKEKRRNITSGMENLSVQSNIFPRDFLQKLMGIKSKQPELIPMKEEDSCEIELNLGLSLGGRFGVDNSVNKLIRSSSVAGCIPIVREDDAAAAATAAPYQSLVRTSSLPVETEEEWRKRKELQTLRRVEAKRRRLEKQRILKGDKDGGGSGGGGGFVEERREIEVNLRGRIEREQYIAAMNWVGSSVASPFGLPTRADHGGGGGKQGVVQPLLSQGSMKSRGGSSSSISELGRENLQGSSSCGEISPSSIQPLQEQSNLDAVGSSGAKTRENPSGPSGAEMESPSMRSEVAGNRKKEIGTNSLEDMPCVFTKGDGPNGRRIEGILYKYGKGEEVRIMCVCHGSFLSPAEFVRHAGGTAVDHPLKHIVINRNSSHFL